MPEEKEDAWCPSLITCHLASVGWSWVVASPTSEADSSPACAGTAAPSEEARTNLPPQT